MGTVKLGDRNLVVRAEAGTTLPSGQASGSMLRIDLDQLARVAALELSQNAPALLGLGELVASLLHPAEEGFVWSAGGPGVGREVRRSLSALFGRFIARWYGMKHLGIVACTAIDGGIAEVHSPSGDQFRAVRISGNQRFLPDWLWTGALTQRPVAGLLEAKASFYRSGLGAGMKSAVAQLSAMRLEYRQGGRWIEMRGKGWAIGAGWATENGLSGGFASPTLRILDPEADGHAWPDDAARAFHKAVVRLQLAQSLEGLGLDDLVAQFETEQPAAIERRLSRLSYRTGRYRGEAIDGIPRDILGARIVRPDELAGEEDVIVGYPESLVQQVLGDGRDVPSGLDLLPIRMLARSAQRLGDAK